MLKNGTPVYLHTTNSRILRLRGTSQIWLHFQLFAELLAEIFFTTIQTRDSGGFKLSAKVSDHTSDIDSDQRSIESSNSSPNGHSSVSASSPRATSRSSSLGDVDELRFKTIRVQFGTKSWRGRKRLEKEVDQFARFRAMMDFVLSEKIVDAKVIEKLPAFPLVAALSIRGVRVVAAAESRSDRFNVVSMDKRDLMELVQALKLTKMLRAFPYAELPDILVRKIPGNKEKTLIGVSTRYDDVLLQSLRSSLVHGVLIRASGSDKDDVEVLTAHDMNELVQQKEAHWVPYLDMVYYQLEPSSAIENWKAKSFLLKSPASTIRGDVVISVDTEKCRLPLDLKEGFVMKQQVEVHPLVRRLEDLKTSSARINVVTNNGTTPSLHKADASAALARTSEQNLKNLFVQYVKDFAAQLVTFGDLTGVSSQQTIPGTSQSRSYLTRANTDSAVFGKSDYAASNARNEPALRRRRSSLATAGAVVNSSSDNSGTYVIDSVHLREAMRDCGINMRFLPLVFGYLENARQPGVRTLVASEIVARMAKTIFRYQLFNDENVTTSHWQSRKLRIIQFIDSIMHGIFHDDLPMRRCPIQECVGDQFWNVDAPILQMLGPFASSAALDYASISAGSAIAQYRHVIRGNPSVLFNALLHAFDAQMTKGMLPNLHENRFVSVQFLRNESDITFPSEGNDPRLAMRLQPTLLWSSLQFFRLQYAELNRLAGKTDQTSGFTRTDRPSSNNFTEVESHRTYFAEILEQARQSLSHPNELRIEKDSRTWEEVHAVRSRLVKALRAASVTDESRGVAKEYCDEAKEIINGTATLFPVEYMVALRCLEMVSANEDEILSGPSEQWKEILSILRFFYRPANQSQFAKSSSSHPLFSIIYFMIHLGGVQGPLASTTSDSLRTQLEISQMQQTWLSVIATVDSNCRRTVSKSWTVDPINAIATKAASFEFEKTRTLHKHMSTSSLSSNASDERNESLNSQGEVKHAKTARALSTESALTASAIRQDILWFVECYLIPPAHSGSWMVSGSTFSNVARSVSSSFEKSSGGNPAPGVGLVWGEPFGLSLDEESQIASAPSESRLANLRSQPSSSIDLLKFPSSLRRVVQVSCGYRHTALVTDNRYLYTFGYGECGRLGHGDEESVETPTAVSFFVSLIETVGASVGGISQVSCGREHTMAVLVNGELYGFGWAEAGRLGTGDTGSCVFPTKVTALHDIQSAACGREHTLALTKQGEVYAFGAGFGGRLGNGSEADEEFPVKVQALEGDKIVRIDAGECHSAVISDKGEVFTWGFGSSGALGNGARENSLLPNKVAGPWADDLETTEDGESTMVTAIACGSYHTIVSTNTGKLYGWGDSAAGQLGPEHVLAPDMVVLSPQEIQIQKASVENGQSTSDVRAVRDIACGTFTSAVCMDDGRLFMWGSAAAGNGAQLKAEDAEVTRVDALKDFSIARIACGECLFLLILFTISVEMAESN